MKKIYMVYLNISDELYKKVEGLNFVYNHFDYYKEDDKWRGLYAWTTKKDRLHDFMEIHNKEYFIVRTVKENDDNYDEFRPQLADAKNSIMKIGNFMYLSKERGQIPLATTKFEKYVSCQEDIDDVATIMFKGLLDLSHIPFPYTFKNPIYESLCKIGYEIFYMDYVFEPDEDEYGTEVRERFYYNLSFNQSLNNGIEVKEPTKDQVNLLVLLFGKLMEK